MLCNGEELGMPSHNEWPQRMGERILIPGAAATTTATTSATSSTSSSNGTHGNMIHAAAANSAAATAARVMDRPGAQEQQQQQQQQALKCPRCDSTNTKFCYYNNYSLSQPRHFCKACKRYWTRGGTLRNVPVGGGCRKNKRAKKPSSAAGAVRTTAATTASDHSPPASLQPYTSPLPPLSLPNHSSSHLDASISPLFYSLPTSGVSSAFTSLANSVPISCTPYDLQPQLSSLGLGFSANQREDAFSLTHLHNSSVGSAAISFMHDYPLFGSSLSSATAASLLVSSLKQQKKAEEYQGLLPYEDLATNGNLGMMKEVKSEGETNVISNNNSHRVEWQIPSENSFDAVGFGGSATAPTSDSSFLYWNPAAGGWPDAANCGSSVAPLI